VIETIREIILDYQQMTVDTGVPRRLKIEAVPGKATVCIGVRRSGKSTYLYQVMERLRSQGVPRENILYLNLFDDRLHNLRNEGMGSVSEAYYSIYPEKKGTETVYCFFDEIQVVSGWEPFVDRLMCTERCEVYLSGSSAQMLSREIATQMRGRALSWEIFPFSFREYLDFKGIDGTGPFSTKQRLLVQKAFDGFWETGGFPEVADLEPHLRVRIHQEYLRAILFRDLVERHGVSHPRAVTDLTHRLMDNIASLHSVNRLTGYLKSLGHKAPKTAVSGYLEWFEDAFFLFNVGIFDASITRRKANPRKVYCVDHALVTSVASGILVNAGHLLENLVFTALRRVTPEVNYYRTQGGREVDFMAQLPDRRRLLVQACETMADPATRKREISALTEAMRELRLDTGTIVTRRDEDRIEVDGGTIEVLPAWRFLLEIDG
jgi:predicted AAA+ superfamily ATPase